MDRTITPDEKGYLLSLTPSDLTFELLCDLFAHKKQDSDDIRPVLGKAKFKTTDMFTLEPSEYFVKETTETTVGKFIYNKFIVEQLKLQDILGYVNWELTNKGVNKVEGILAAALTNDLIDVVKYTEYIDHRDWIGEIMHFPLAGSMTPNILKAPKEVIDLKHKLFRENKDKLEQGDIFTAEKIEKETISLAHDILKDDPGMELFDSGARGSFNNSYKNINIMKGPIFNNITGKYDIIESSLMEGIKKENINTFGNSIIAGSFPKAVDCEIFNLIKYNFLELKNIILIL